MRSMIRKVYYNTRMIGQWEAERPQEQLLNNTLNDATDPNQILSVSQDF